MEPGKTPPTIRIGPNHRRILSVRLRLLEDYCLQLLSLLHPARSAFTTRAALPRRKAAALESAVAALVANISRIKSELELEAHRQNVQREAMALVASMTNNIEELHPRYLTGYGEVPKPLAGYLKGCCSDLAEEVEAVNRILADH